MNRKKISNEFMEKILTDSAWKSLSGNFQWTEQWLEKYKDMVDWKEISDNCNIQWTPSMLEKFKKLIDWKALSQATDEYVLTEECLDRFKDYLDWAELSENTALQLSCALIDKYIDRWDWAKLINRFGEDIYSVDFLEKYIDHIPTSQLQNSSLWRKLLEERKENLKIEILA